MHLEAGPNKKEEIWMKEVAGRKMIQVIRIRGVVGTNQRPLVLMWDLLGINKMEFVLQMFKMEDLRGPSRMEDLHGARRMEDL